LPADLRLSPVALAAVLALAAIEAGAALPWFVGPALANHCTPPCDAPPCDAPPCDCYYCWSG